MRVDYLESERGWSWVLFTTQNQPFAASLIYYVNKGDAVRAFKRIKKLFVR